MKSSVPPEVWEAILCKVTDPEDVFSCSQVCKSWKIFLEPTRPLWLFSKIFSLIYSYMCKRKDGQLNTSEPSTTDILQCRLVCHVWKKSVDSFLETNPVQQVFAFQDKEYDIFTQHYLFQREDKIHKFLSWAESYNGENPFICRSVCFWIEMDDNFLTQVLELLSRYGRHIWCLDLQIDMNPIEFIRFLHQCLSHVPNLRKLKLYKGGPGESLEMRKSKEYNELKDFINLNPFPSLIHFKILHLTSMAKIFYEFALASYSQQLEKLNVLRHPRTTTQFLWFINNQLSSVFLNLQELQVCLGSKEAIVGLKSLQCPLKILRVLVDSPKVEMTDYLKLFSHFGATLQVISLQWIYFRHGETNWDRLSDEDNNPSQLTKIQLLSLVNPPGLFEFLSWFGGAGLPKLHIHKGVDQEDDREVDGVEVIQITGWEDKMYESNIWERVPSLKEIRLDGWYYHDYGPTNETYKFIYYRENVNSALV